MPNTIPANTLEKFTTFGDLLRFLRRRAGITQLDFSIAVGYSDSQISRLEQNMRLPDLPTIEARFIPALDLDDEPTAVARLMELAAAVRREDAPVLGICPYKGLDYFDEEDADLFTGREILTENLTQRVLALASKEDSALNRFFAVVGSSGSGKSSLVRAGLVPALRWNKVSANWPIHVLTPTASPLESLASTLTRENGSLTRTATITDDFLRERRSLSLFIKREPVTARRSYQLLVIDQFEECFTLCHSEEQRSAFIDNLIYATMDEAGRAIVIVTLRADFYAYCANYPQLREALASNQVYIGAMSDDEMRRAVEEPARHGRWDFETGLVDLILHDVGHEPGALPLLSHALYETWQRRHGHTLTLSGYIAAGGVRGAIAETAEAVFADQFNHRQQEIARRIFIRLTELGDETATGDTRRRATLNELILKPEETELTQAVINALADARLITTSEDSVQVAHEALIREWPTLRSWLEDNREGLRLHQHLTEAAEDWLAADREPGILFRGVRLSRATEWASMHNEDMNPLEREFLAASVSYGENEVAERENQRKRELEAAQKLAETEKQRAEEGIRSAQRLKFRTIVISIMGTLAVLLAAFAFLTWLQSTRNAALNHTQKLAHEALVANQSGRGDLALRLALEAVNSAKPQVEAISALRTVAFSPGTRSIISRQGQPIQAIAFIPGIRTFFSGACAEVDKQGACLAGELALWDLDSQKEVLRWYGHGSGITAVAVSLDGRTLVSGAEDGTILLWDTTGKLIGQLLGHTAKITALAIISTTGSLLSGSYDGTMILWGLHTGEKLQTYRANTSPITALAVARNNLRAASAHLNGSIFLWNLYNENPEQEIQDQGSNITSLTMTVDGNSILFTNASPSGKYLRMVDWNDREIQKQMTFVCDPGLVTLPPDTSYALMICQAGIYMVDIVNWSIVYSNIESPGVISEVAVSPDQHTGLTASEDGSLRVWNLDTVLDIETTHTEFDRVNAFVISQDGKYFFLNNYNIPVLWDIQQGKSINTFVGFYGSISPNGIAISPNSQFVAAVGWVRTGMFPTKLVPAAIVWDAEKAKIKCQMKDLLATGTAIAFSPDNHYVIIGTQDFDTKSGELVLWDIESCEKILQFDGQSDISSIAFNSDGTQAVSGSSLSGGAILWDIVNGTAIQHFSDMEGGGVTSVGFGPDDKTILGAGFGELYQWNVETANLIQRFSGSSSYPTGMAISPDGKYVISSTALGELILWDLSSGEEMRRYLTHTSITGVAFSADSQIVFGMSMDGELLQWHITEKALPELREWIKSNRYVRQLTCEERQQYQVEPLCKP